MVKCEVSGEALVWDLDGEMDWSEGGVPLLDLAAIDWMAAGIPALDLGAVDWSRDGVPE